MPMPVSVSIYTPDKDLGTNITIEPIENTNNYSYIVEGDDENGPFNQEGVIYNFTGNYMELVREVLNGRTMYRED